MEYPHKGTFKGSTFRSVASSETQGQIVGARESLNGREKMARRKVKPLSAPGSPRMGRSLKDGHLCGYCRNRSRFLAIRRQHIKQFLAANSR